VYTKTDPEANRANLWHTSFLGYWTERCWIQICCMPSSKMSNKA